MNMNRTKRIEKMNVAVIPENRQKIQEVINKFEGRCRTNTIVAEQVFSYAEQILSIYRPILPWQSFAGCVFECDPNAQSVHCPQRYKGSIASTKFVLRINGNGKFGLIELRREFPNSNYLGIVAKLTDTAKKHLLAYYTAPMAESGANAAKYLECQSEREQYYDRYVDYYQAHCS